MAVEGRCADHAWRTPRARTSRARRGMEAEKYPRRHLQMPMRSIWAERICGELLAAHAGRTASPLHRHRPRRHADGVGIYDLARAAPELHAQRGPSRSAARQGSAPIRACPDRPVVVIHRRARLLPVTISARSRPRRAGRSAPSRWSTTTMAATSRSAASTVPMAATRPSSRASYGPSARSISFAKLAEDMGAIGTRVERAGEQDLQLKAARSRRTGRWCSTSRPTSTSRHRPRDSGPSWTSSPVGRGEEVARLT